MTASSSRGVGNVWSVAVDSFGGTLKIADSRLEGQIGGNLTCFSTYWATTFTAAC
jgi:hypothetical protein